MPESSISDDWFSIRRLNPKHLLLALLLIMALFWIRVLLNPLLGHRAVFTPFYPIILGIAWWLGLGPALVSVVVCTIGVVYYFIQPLQSFEVPSTPETLQVLLNVAGLTLCAIISDQARRAKARLAIQNQELREGEFLLNMVTSNARVGLVVIDSDHRYLSVNEAYSEMLGLTPPDIVGKHLSQVLGPIYAHAKPRLDRAFAGEHINFEQVLPGRGPHTSERVLAVTYEGRGDPLQRKVVTAVVLDITQRRAAERALSESQERLRTLAAVVEHSMDFIGICTTDMRPLFINDAGLNMVGLRNMAEAQQHPVLDFFHPDERARIERDAIPALQRDGLWKGAVRFQNFMTGETIHTYWNVFSIRDEKGKTLAWATISPNLNELRQAEDTLRAKRERTQLLNETLAHLLTSNDPEKMVSDLFPRVTASLRLDVYFNYLIDPESDVLRLHSAGGIDAERRNAFSILKLGQALCGRSALTAKPLILPHLQEVSDPDAAALKEIGLRAYICHPMMVGERLIGTLSFGSRMRSHYTIDEINFLRTITQYVAIALDRSERIGELRKRGDALRESESRLKEADRRKDEFIALLAHELRNPLSPIRNGLAILNGNPTPEMAGRARSMIGRQAAHMTKLIDDLLDVARMKSGKLKLQKSDVDLCDIVQKTLEDYGSSLESAGHRIAASLATGPLWVHGDPTRLSQMAENLLTNAAKFSDTGATIAVELREESGQAVLSVTDTGIGLEPHTISRLFEPFMQAESSLDRSRGGLGLGLALVKGLADAHNATITAFSRGLGQGSTFTLRVPVLAGAPTDTRASARLFSRQPSAQRVLLIEDNLDAAESMKIYLELAGHEVRMAHDGREGLATAKSFKPAAVVCDIGLPGDPDGYGVARKLRGDDAFANTRLIALSGYGQEKDRALAREAGFDLHLTKPVDPEHLNQILQSPVEAR